MRNQFEPAKLPTFEPLKPLTLPNLNQPETESVPAKQSFQEFAMAGGGVPAQYKGREHVWHAKVNKHEAHMAGGGLLKGMIKGVQKVLPAAERDANLAKMLEGSKIPETLYHGTGSDISEFRPNTFFSDDPRIAGMYAKSSQRAVEGVGPNIVPVKARFENPYIHDESQSRKQGKNFSQLIAPDAPAKGRLKEALRILREKGHDSVVLKNFDDIGGRQTQYIALDPSKVKSAIGNRGTYDTSDANLAKAAGGAIHMKKGGDPLDEFVPPRFRSAGRRPAGQDDRKASASMPVDFARGAISGALGAPGDIESLIRMLPGLDEKTVLPTSEDIEKRLPFRSDTPQGRAAAGLGTLAGGFYTGPGSPFNVAAKGVKLAGEGLGTLKGSGAGTKGLAGQRGVVKMPGGNFLTGRVEKNVNYLKRHVPEESEIENINRAAGQDVRYPMRQADIALNKWVDSNLSNYIKKQMATPDDPVRALAEQGITHKRNLLDEYPRDAEGMKSERKAAGFPEEGMAQSPMAKAWERASDESLVTHRAGDIQEMPGKAAKREDAEAKMIAARDALYHKFIDHLRSIGVSEDEANYVARGTPFDQKAKAVGDTAFEQADLEYRLHHSPMMESYMQLGRDNPWISKVDPETTIYSPYTGDLGFDHIVDVLREDLTAGRIRPEQMNKISISDAVRRTHQYDQDMAKKMAEAQIKATEGMPVHKDYGDKGYKWIELQKPQDLTELPAGYKAEPYKGQYSEGVKILNPAGEQVSVGESLDDALKNMSEVRLEEALKYEGETMGHCVGGYCPDVLEGRSRIFSLRSAKGEPHVTVETAPYGSHNEDHMFAELTDKLGRQPTKQEVSEAMQAAPQRIVQIKGKQNRAPKEEYLPYVQDFVKGGKWADVGDIQNTGLYSAKHVGDLTPQSIQMSRNARKMAIERAKAAGELPEYMTRDEYEAMLQKHVPEDVWAAEKAKRAAEDDELLRQLRPPEEGMAHGGEVHMAGGGAIKAALARLGKFATESDLKAIKEAGRTAHEQDAFIRAAKDAEIEEKLKSMPARSKAANIEMGMYHPVGGGAKLSKPFEAMHSTRVKNPKVDMPEVRIMTPEDLYREEAGLFPLVGDKADTGTFLTHIGEKEFEVPVGLGGGPRYMDANLNPANRSRSAAWESGTGRVTSLGNQARRIGEGGRPAYGIYTAGSGTNTDFNIMGANAILQQLGQSKLTKKAEKAFDQAMRVGTKAFPPIPDWPGIRSPQAEDMLLDKSQGILRTKLFDTMGKEDFQSMGFPDVPATRKAIMDPQLLDVPTHEAGFRIARMDPTGRVIEDPLHPSDYPTAMAGELEGQLNMGVDYKDMFSTHFANRRLLSQPESGDYYSFSRAFPIQYADQEWLDKIKKAQEAKEKLIKTGSYAKGGDVKPKGGLAAATKSCSCHD